MAWKRERPTAMPIWFRCCSRTSRRLPGVQDDVFRIAGGQSRPGQERNNVIIVTGTHLPLELRRSLYVVAPLGVGSRGCLSDHASMVGGSRPGRGGRGIVTINRRNPRPSLCGKCRWRLHARPLGPSRVLRGVLLHLRGEATPEGPVRCGGRRHCRVVNGVSGVASVQWI